MAYSIKGLTTTGAFSGGDKPFTVRTPNSLKARRRNLWLLVETADLACVSCDHNAALAQASFK